MHVTRTPRDVTK